MCETIVITDRDQAVVEFGRRVTEGDTAAAAGLAQSVWVFFSNEGEFSGCMARMIKLVDTVLPGEMAIGLLEELQQLRFVHPEELLATA